MNFPENLFGDDVNIDELISDITNNTIPEHKSELMASYDAAANVIMNESKKMINSVLDYKELLMVYSCAIKEIRTKFDVLNTEFNTRYQRNPIKFISHRVKSSASIMEKLEKLNIPFSVANIENNIFDIAGIRVICSFVDDIYVIAKALLKQDDIKLIRQKDYIANPKPNGYRSLHLIVSVPVFFANQTKEVNVEVQIRTIAMDFWASLEHSLKYKHNVKDEESIVSELKECADVISSTDEKMLNIRKKIEQNADAPSEEDLIFEKMKRLDIPID